jgi:hypothetical protein
MSQRKDIRLIEIDNFVVEEGFNVREDMGDLKALAASLKESYEADPYNIPAIRGHNQRGVGYVLTNGHRTLEAAKIAGIPSLPFLPVSSDPLDREILQATLNNGKEFNEMEKARLIQRIETAFFEKNPDASKEEARKLCMESLQIPQSSYYNYKNLLKPNISPIVQQLVAEGKVSSTVVRETAKEIEDPAALTDAIRKMVKETTKGVEEGASKAKKKVTPKNVNKPFEKLPLGKKVAQLKITLADSGNANAQLLLGVFTQLEGDATLEDIVAQVNEKA